MRFNTGIHPRQWHRGAWLLAFLSAALVLLLTHRATGGRAFAMEPEPVPPPVQESPPPSEAVTIPPVESVAPDESLTPDESAPPPEGTAPAGGMASEPSPTPAAAGRSGSGYVSEIVDSSYTVGPAEFFALDLPMVQPGAKAVHLSGTVTTKGKKDIIVRLFRASDYDRWLKQKSGRKPQAFWTSPRSGNLTLDQDLPAGEPVVLLLDNGFSIRTPKKVICQLQLRYQRGGTETFVTEGGGSGAGMKATTPEDNLPIPRSNSDMELPPPPPPPPTGY